MKKITKIGAIISAALLVSTVALAGCGGDTEPVADTNTDSSADVTSTANTNDNTATDTDWETIQSNGKMVIGITYFEPMNYMDENNELTGFETEFAKAVCNELGVEPVFQKIDWESKEVELNAKTIDCIWNGMTITPERQENLSISTPYMENKQVMVVKAANAEKFEASAEGASVVAEKKSAGESVATTEEFFAKSNYTAVDSQAKTLLEVKAGTADIAIIDYVMSIGSLGEGSDYADLTVVESKEFSPEQYGIAFRKNAVSTTEQVNAAIQKLANDGTLQQIAEKYHLDSLLLVKAES